MSRLKGTDSTATGSCDARDRFVVGLCDSRNRAPELSWLIPSALTVPVTATAQIWEASVGAWGDVDRGRQLGLSMDPGSPVFGPVAYKLTLSQVAPAGRTGPAGEGSGAVLSPTV